MNILPWNSQLSIHEVFQDLREEFEFFRQSDEIKRTDVGQRRLEATLHDGGVGPIGRLYVAPGQHLRLPIVEGVAVVEFQTLFDTPRTIEPCPVPALRGLSPFAEAKSHF